MAESVFTLYDLKISVDRILESCTCAMGIGDSVSVSGCKLTVDTKTGFCFYALQSAMPLIAAKQRINHPADWMETDEHVMCPGQTCGLRMRIERVGKTEFDHDSVSEVKWSDVASQPKP